MASPSTPTDDQRIAAAFAKVEEELISSMMRNLDRHRVEEAASGIEWAQWQALQLESLDRYARKNAVRHGRRFDRLNARIEGIVRGAYAEAGAEQERAILEAVRRGWKAPRTPGGDFFSAPHERLDALIRALHTDLMRAEHAVLRRANDQYRQVIFDAQVYAQSGAGTYAKAVDMATKDFLAKGVDGIVYRNGARHTIPDYASMCLRTSTKRAALVAEGDMRSGWGVNTVVVDRRGDACPECMEWVGMVLVDDVYGGGTADEAAMTGRPLLSEAMDAGLFHPNCKDTVSTWFPGVSDMPETPTAGEKARAEARESAEEAGNAARNAEARYGRLSEYSLDPSNSERYAAKEAEWAERAEAVEKADPAVVEEAAEARRGIVDGGDIIGKWERRPQMFDFEIEDVLDAQGFDGKPRIVGADEFDQMVNQANGGKGLIMQRSYSAPTQEVLDAYRDMLYDGKWYVDCSTGGSQYGQGMYCAADYTGRITPGMREEMVHYHKLNAEKLGGVVTTDEYKLGLIEDYVGRMTGTAEERDATRAYLRTKAHVGEVTSDERRAAGKVLSRDSMRVLDTQADVITQAREGSFTYVETMTLDPSAKIITWSDAIELQDEAVEHLIDQGLTPDQVRQRMPSDLGSFVASKGYDAINAEGHGASGSYTVVLNRTKLIIRRP